MEIWMMNSSRNANAGDNLTIGNSHGRPGVKTAGQTEVATYDFAANPEEGIRREVNHTSRRMNNAASQKAHITHLHYCVVDK